jgi:hypothetical protein
MKKRGITNVIPLLFYSGSCSLLPACLCFQVLPALPLAVPDLPELVRVSASDVYPDHLRQETVRSFISFARGAYRLARSKSLKEGKNVKTLSNLS